MMHEFQEYVDSLKGVENTATAFYDHLIQYLDGKKLKQINAQNIDRLIRNEQELDHEGYFRTLLSIRDDLDLDTLHYLYINRNRIRVLSLFEESLRKKIASIPVVLVPFSGSMEAFIINTETGHKICFSDKFLIVYLTLLQILTKTIDFVSLVPAYPQYSLEEAAEKVLTLSMYVAKRFRGGFPLSINLDGKLLKYADLGNDKLHHFVFLHEYYHYLFRHTENSTRDIEQEIQVDLAAIDMLKTGEALVDTHLFTSIYSFFIFNLVCKRMIGIQDLNVDETMIRAQIAFTRIFDSKQIVLRRENRVMAIALEKASKTY